AAAGGSGGTCAEARAPLFAALCRRLPPCQNTHLTPACSWRGSPSPERIVPSKFLYVVPDAGSLKLSALVTLKISIRASSCPRGPAGNGREMRMSQEKYALSLRMVFRRRMCRSAQIRSCGLLARIPLGWLPMHCSDVG